MLAKYSTGIKYIPVEYLLDNEIILYAIKHFGRALEFIPIEHISIDIVINALKQNIKAYEYCPYKFKNNKFILSTLNKYSRKIGDLSIVRYINDEKILFTIHIKNFQQIQIQELFEDKLEYKNVIRSFCDSSMKIFNSNKEQIQSQFNKLIRICIILKRHLISIQNILFLDYIYPPIFFRIIKLLYVNHR